MADRKERISAATEIPYPLGRHIHHDPRSFNFPAEVPPAPPRTVMHRSWIPVLNQESLGSCTGHALVGALGVRPLYRRDSAPSLTNALAVAIYQRATEIDPFPGTWPPTDTGSSGLDACRAALERGLISRYEWAFGLDAVLAVLATTPVMIGIRWYEAMFEPTTDDECVPIGRIVGGHEIVLTGIDAQRHRVRFRNSWGANWGKGGNAWFSFDTLGMLLEDQGDAVVPRR